MRPLLVLLACCSFLPRIALAGEAPGPRTLALADAVAVALESNPVVQAARIDVTAAEAARRGAGAPTRNPEISIGAGARFTPDGTGADLGVSFQIPLDLGGTARHRRDRETAGLAEARARLRWAELRVTTATRIAFAEAVAAELRLGLAEEAVALGLEIERAARRRHEIGEVSLLQPNSAALDRAAAEARRASAQGELAEAIQRLQAVLGLPAGDALVLVRASSPAWPTGLETDDGALVARALAGRDDLVAAHEHEIAAVAELRAARSVGVPDLSVGGGWEREGGEADIVGGEVAFEIPLQRNQIQVARAEGGARRASLGASTAEQQVGREVRAALTSWRAAEERHRVTSGEALTLAEANLRLVLRAYESGEEELLPVLMMQRQALTAREAAIDAELAVQRASAELEQALGEAVF